MENEFTLEKLAISKRLHAVEEKLNILIVAREEQHKTQQFLIETLREMMSKHEKFIYGNGRDGAKVRLDRLENYSDSQRWHFRTLWTAVVGLLAATVCEFISVVGRHVK